MPRPLSSNLRQPKILMQRTLPLVLLSLCNLIGCASPPFHSASEAKQATRVFAEEPSAPLVIDRATAATNSQAGRCFIAISIANTANSAILVSARAMLLPETNSLWERDFDSQFYFVGAQLSAPQVPSVSASLVMPAGEERTYTVSVPAQSSPFKLEFVCFREQPPTLASLPKSVYTDSFYVQTPTITLPRP